MKSEHAPSVAPVQFFVMWHFVMVEPYYERDGITIYHGDSFEIVPQLENVNCVVTSPPYNQKIDGFKPSGMHKETNWINRISTSYADNLPEHVYQSQQSLLLAYLYEATAKDASVFYNHKIRWRNGEYISPLEWMRLCAWKIRQEIIWCRDGSVTMNAKMFPPSEERIVWLDKGKHKWNQECAKFLSTWKIKSEANSPHPVAYPLVLPMRCISATTDEGDLVLDPYMGSGTTLRAAKDLGRDRARRTILRNCGGSYGTIGAAVCHITLGITGCREKINHVRKRNHRHSVCMPLFYAPCDDVAVPAGVDAFSLGGHVFER